MPHCSPTVLNNNKILQSIFSLNLAECETVSLCFCGICRSFRYFFDTFYSFNVNMNCDMDCDMNCDMNFELEFL